jgi:transposase-like protein
MATRLTTTREERGQTIAQHNDQIKRIDENFYAVKSQNGNGEYAVTKIDQEWICECPDNRFRQVKCKHIFAVEFSKSLRDCHKYFTFNIGFERMKHNPLAITSAMQLYFSGESLRNTMKSLRLLGVEVSYRTILNWIRKYTKIMQSYVENIVPNVSDTWRADELYVKIKGDMKYLFALIDDETRYWISQEVAETKDKHDVRTLFTRAKYLMGKQPKTLVTDGLATYSRGSMEVFPQALHTRHIRLQGDMNNNKMERFNGEIRDREKVMRGLKTKDTPILVGAQIFHNYIRAHEGLNGKTPSEACGIKVEGKNKWITLIQNASKTK